MNDMLTRKAFVHISIETSTRTISYPSISVYITHGEPSSVWQVLESGHGPPLNRLNVLIAQNTQATSTQLAVSITTVWKRCIW